MKQSIASVVAGRLRCLEWRQVKRKRERERERMRMGMDDDDGGGNSGHWSVSSMSAEHMIRDEREGRIPTSAFLKKTTKGRKG
jgi:hypothetical protein